MRNKDIWKENLKELSDDINNNKAEYEALIKDYLK